MNEKEMGIVLNKYKDLMKSQARMTNKFKQIGTIKGRLSSQRDYVYNRPRDPERIDRMLKRLRCVWKNRPDMTLTDVISRLTDHKSWLEDDDLEERINERIKQNREPKPKEIGDSNIGTLFSSTAGPSPWIKQIQDAQKYIARNMAIPVDLLNPCLEVPLDSSEEEP